MPIQDRYLPHDQLHRTQLLGNGPEWLHEPIGGMGVWNGQFEQGPDDIPEGWEVYYAHATSYANREADGFAGNMCFRGGNTGTNRGAYIYQRAYMPVDETRLYNLHGAFRGSVATAQVYFGCACYTDAKVFISNVSVLAAVAPGVAWVAYDRTIGPTGTIGWPANTRYARIYVYLQYLITLANAYAECDDLCFAENSPVMLTADATGRAMIATGYFDAATTLDKFAANSFTNAVLLDVVQDGAFQADAATRALFADGIWTSAELAVDALSADATGRAVMAAGYFNAATVTSKFAAGSITATEIANRTRTLFVPGTRGWQIAENDANSLPGYAGAGWHCGDGVNTVIYGEFYVPSDYVSGLTVEAVVESAAAVGNVYIQLICYYAAAGETWNAANDSTGYSAIAAAATLQKRLSTASNAAAGDFVTCRFSRDASHGSDTSTATLLYLKGFLITFTADG